MNDKHLEKELIEARKRIAELEKLEIKHKEAMRRLQDSEKRFRLLVKHSSDIIQIIDEEANPSYISNQITRILGYEPEELMGVSSFTHVHPDDLPHVMKVFAEGLAEPGSVRQAEYRYRHKNGSWIDLEAVGCNLLQDPAVHGIVLNIRDISERKQSEDALTESHVRFKAIFEQSGDYVFLLDPFSTPPLEILDANESAFREHGYSREELIGQSVFFVDVGLDEQRGKEILQDVLSGKTTKFETIHRRKDGSSFPVEIVASVVDLPNRPPIFLSIERNITERKEAEEKLSHSHNLMRYILEHNRSAVAVHDLDMNYIYVSKRYLDEYNVKEDDVIGRHHYEVFPDLPQKWRDVHQRVLKGEVCSAEDDPYFKDDGSTEWTRWECRPWYEIDGSIGGLIVYTEVITDRVRAKEEKEKLQNQLQQAMKMEAVGRLAGGVAHDFNNLLTGITGNVQLSLMDLSPEDPLTPVLKDIGHAADSAAALTRQLLAFSRKQLIEPKIVNLNELIQSLQKMLTRLIGEDIELQTKLDKQLGSVKIDPGQFEQILVNLAVNARDAMPYGGKLTVETTNVDLDEQYCHEHPDMAPGRYVMLAVGDTGIGMSDDVKDHLFEPFFTTKPKGRGTGLGLATIFGAVNQALGNIDVFSKEGEGTTFKIYLPLVAQKALPLEKAHAAIDVPGGHETVLVVEDEKNVRYVAIKILQRFGYNVLNASNGEQALLLAKDYPDEIHLLMTDVIMPGMNGRQLAERIVEIYPEIKILYCSGYTEDTIGTHGVIEEGINFIAKPYTPNNLAKKLRDAIDK